MDYLTSDLKVVGSRPIRPDGVDKVIGRAIFAADTRAAGMLWGKIKRSPHAHARILSIDTSAAKALPGVKAVVTAADFPEITSEEAFVGEGPMNFRDLSRNIMARDKALYEGHAIAAVAAMTQEIANQALELIDVTYEVLPFVIDVDEAMAPDAPVLHEDLFTTGIDPKPNAPSNIAKVVTFKKGDVEAGFRQAEVIVEGRYTTRPVHQGYIEPHACLATYLPDGQITIHASSQGHFMIRAYTAKLLGIDMANIRVNPAEIQHCCSPAHSTTSRLWSARSGLFSAGMLAPKRWRPSRRRCSHCLSRLCRPRWARIPVSSMRVARTASLLPRPTPT
jgi:CO/xanthine dehydrogenase Mo-binding subunit